MITRFAPTPNGELHLGNLYNLLLTWALARRHEGRVLVRFDDIDEARCAGPYHDQILLLLARLGLPVGGVLQHQPRRLDLYRAALAEIPHYLCRCSRKELLDRSGGYHYDGHCRELGPRPQDGPHAVRFRSPRGPAHDFVLWRKEDIPAYHLTSLVDDRELGVTHVVRGEDLRESTEVQREISRAMPGDPLGGVCFLHHPLLRTPAGEKLAKSRGDGDLSQLLALGDGPALWRALGERLALPLCGPDSLRDLPLDALRA